MSTLKKEGFFTRLTNLFLNGNTQTEINKHKEIQPVATIKTPKKMNNTSSKKTRSFEEIGLLFGLSNKTEEKKTYLATIDTDILNTRENLSNDIEKLKDDFNELLKSTKNIREELRSLIDDLESNRNSTVIKLSKTIRALLVESDFDNVEKKEIVNKVLDEGVSAVASVKNSIMKSQNTIGEMINSFHASSPIIHIYKLYERYLEELKKHQIAKTELQKGFAAGLAIKRNLDDIESVDNSQSYDKE